MSLSLFVFNSCEEDGVGTMNINYVSFESTTASFPVDIDGTSDKIIKVYSTKKTGSDRTFGVNVDLEASSADPASYTVPATVTIPANTNVGELLVTVSDLNIGVSGKKLVLNFNNEEDLLMGAACELKVIQSCPGNEVFLDIIFDGYGSETTWKLVDSENNLVADGGPYEDGDAKFSTSFCLGVGSYTFTAYDAYGDGLSYPNEGSVKLTKNEVELVNFVGDFGAEATKTFEIE